MLLLLSYGGKWWAEKEFAPSQLARQFYRLLSSLVLSLPMVSVTGFEPVVSWSQATRFTKLSYTLIGGSGEDRTHDHGIAAHCLASWLRNH